MPERPDAKHVRHPFRASGAAGSIPASTDEAGRSSKTEDEADPDPPAYAELAVTSNFTFLTGASHPEELVNRAAALGCRGIALTDHNTLAGVVRAHLAAKAAGLAFAVGCRLILHTAGTATHLLVHPVDRDAYGRLCALLTLGKRRGAKDECHLTLHDFLEHQQGLLTTWMPPPGPLTDDQLAVAEGLVRAVDGDRLSLAIWRRFGPDDRGELAQQAMLADQLRVPLVAVNDVYYHDPQRQPLADVLTCIRHGCTLEEAGTRLHPHAERYLKPPEEMHRLFADYPQALRRAAALLDRASAFSLDALRYEYPHETCPPGRSAMAHLRDLTEAGARKRYPRGIPEAVRERIEHELALIAEMDYPHYFLTVHDIVQFARGRQILCQGRGAAANSAVCYCLKLTAVDPDRIDLLFERFISRERNEPPDIDIDFEHERREEVIQYLYRKYGRHRAALTAEVITYRARSAVRDVGKALGLSLDLVDRLAKDLHWFERDLADPARFAAFGLDANDPTLGRLSALCQQILGFPRHLSQHVGGFVLTEQPLDRTVPIANAAMADRTVIEWDKDDIDALGILKVDVLGLGMLTCVRKCFDLVGQHHGRSIALHTVPAEDPRVYDMICRADTVGVFQIESRAQMSMLPRLRPRTFYDLVIEVAIVRPGPIQGGMVHPYLRRRTGEQAVTYPSAAVRRVLEKTLGVPLFQEQAMQLAIHAAGFTPDQADQLRRAMAAWKRKGDQIVQFGERLVDGMIANGYDADFAQRCFDQIKGFSEYGFPESHAASFALIVYVSAWLKCHHPAAFAAGLINSQPMGFYAPAQIARDAEAHGVELRPVDVLYSDWDCTLEPGADGDDGSGDARDSPALRLGMRLVKGLARADAETLEAVADRPALRTVEQLRRLSGISAAGLQRLADADAFGSFGLNRQRARWMTQRFRDQPLPLFDAPDESDSARPAVSDTDPADQCDPALPPVAMGRQVAQDYRTTGMSLKAHPLAFVRPRLHAMGVTPTAQLADPQRTPHGRRVRVAGLVLVRQRPSTASGVVFITLEDETGIANLIIRPHVFQRDRRSACHSHVLLAEGRIERQGQVVHVLADRLERAPAADTTPRARDRSFR